MIGEGWTEVELGEILSVSSGSGLTAKNMTGSGHPVYGGNGIVGYHADYLFEERKLVIGRVGVRCGVTHITKPRSWVTDNALVVTFKQPCFDLEFMKLKLQFENLNKLSNSTAQPVISGAKIYSYKISVPPLAIQRAIVSKIEELFSELDDGVKSLKKAQEQLKIYRQAVLKAAFEGKLTAEWQSTKMPIGDILKEIGQGWSPKCKSSVAETDEWGVIKTTAIQPNRFVENENKTLPTELEPRYHLELRGGEVLITRAGPRSRVGVACLVERTREKLLVCDKVYRLVLDDRLMDRKYFVYWLNSSLGTKKVDSIKTGINDSGVNLTQSRFKNLEIEVPLTAMQKSVVDMIETTFSRIEQTENSIEEAFQREKRLRQSILKRAFEGKLLEPTS